MGSHPRTRDLFDASRTDCDLWVFNEAVSNKTFPRADVVFQLHAEAIWRNPKNRNDPGHFAWLTSQTETPVYMQQQYSDVPKAVQYPLEAIKEMINDANHFLTSSVSEAMALVAYQNLYKRVEIYGVAMETNTEYQWQREGVAYWYGYLKGKGIDVYFADETFRALVYGYEGEVVLPYEVFEQRAEEVRPLVEKHSGEYQAAALTLQKVVDEFANGDNSEEIAKAIQIQTGLSQVLGMLDGALQENLRYKQKADTMKEAAGDFIFSRQEFESAAKNLSDLASEWQTKVNMISGQGELVHQNIIRSAKGSPKREKLLEGYKSLLQQYLQAHNQAMIYTGAARENFQYMQRLDKSIRAAGGEKSEQAIFEQMKEANNVVAA